MLSPKEGFFIYCKSPQRESQHSCGDIWYIKEGCFGSDILLQGRAFFKYSKLQDAQSGLVLECSVYKKEMFLE